MLTQNDIIEKLSLLKEIGFKKDGPFHFVKDYKGLKSSAEGRILITGEEWIDDQVVIEVAFPFEEARNVTQYFMLKIKALQEYAEDAAKISISIKEDLEKVKEIFKNI